MSMKLCRKFVTGVNLPKKFATHFCHEIRNDLERLHFFTQKWEISSYNITILFLDYLLTPSNGFVMPSFNYVHMKE